MHDGIPSSLDTLRAPVASLRRYEANPRRGDVDAIVDSLRAHGQYRPIVVRRETGEILAGNHTYLAAMELGWEEIAVTYVDCDDDEAARIVLVDNRLNDVALYDDEALAAMLQSLPDLGGTGFDQDAYETALAKVTDPNFEPDLGGLNRLDEKKPVTCPECGHTWTPA